MNPLIQQIIGEARDDYETRTYTVNARPDHLDELEKFFSWVNSTRAGHSGSAELGIDGDGAARVTIERKDGELKKPDEDVQPGSGKGPEYRVYLESVNENAVIVKQRPVDYYVCPHCHEEIHEKGTYSEDNGDTMRHRNCGGIVEYPETPDNQIVDWLRPYVQKAREERKARLAAKTPPPKGFVVGDTTGTSL